MQLSEFVSCRSRHDNAALIAAENMRREGFELSVSPPKVVYREECGQKLEPVEEVICEVEDEHAGSVIEVGCSLMLPACMPGCHLPKMHFLRNICPWKVMMASKIVKITKGMGWKSLAPEQKIPAILNCYFAACTAI